MNVLILRKETDLLTEVGRRIVGATVLGVTYRQTERGGLNVPPVGVAHEVDLEVVLRLSTGVISVTWERDDLVEGLALGWEDAADPEGVAAVPADNSESWRGLVGHAITNVYASWQVSEVNCPESMWSIRFSFGPRLHVVIALGELDVSGWPMYHPDSLLLLFDENMARSYRPSGAIGSAWGEQSL
ncbi:hypothetical protein ACFQS1_40040 [Paractinoplanes rhizophilus]|uniref:Uncharacterized protein n=1 Tax=Paractinoplanes rhizophilus TaxID=1416877 RepID=A0ABW2I5K8_9ACTN